MANATSMKRKYKQEDRWHQIVVSVGRNDKLLKSAIRDLAEEQDRSISKLICIILNKYLKDNGRL